MKRKHFFLCVLIAFALFGFRLSAQVRVVCIGNSITEGYGLTTPGTQSYPAQLGKLLGNEYTVLNCGVSARTLLKKGDIPYWNESKFTDAKNFDPQIVIISLGTNDSKPQNWDAHSADFFSDYKEMVNAFRVNGKTPTIYVCFPPPAFVDNFSIRDEVIRNGIIPLVDSIRSTLGTLKIDYYHQLLSYSSYFSDGIHPNEQGAGIMAQLALNAIKNCPSIAINAAVNGGVALPLTEANVNAGDSIILQPSAADGTWSWSGPNNFKSTSAKITLRNVQLAQGGIYTLTYNNADGCKLLKDFIISINGCTAAIINPYLLVSNGSWQNKASVTVAAGNTVTFGPQSSDNSTNWHWTGPCGFKSDARQIALSLIQNKQAGDYIATCYSVNGCKTTKVFTITVTGEDVCTIPIVPYVNVGGVWKQQTTVSVASGASISFGPQPNDGGSWKWTGPNKFTSTARDFSINNIKVAQSGIYTATFTNGIGCVSSVNFKVTVDGVSEVNNPKEQNSLPTFYPNPANELVLLKDIPALTTIRVLDVAGRALLRQNSSENNGDVEIDLNVLKTGNYYIRLENTEVDLSYNKTLKLVKK